MRNSQGRLEPVQLVHRDMALPGVNRYLFCRGCRRSSLWRWSPPVPAPGRCTPVQQQLLAAAIKLAARPADCPLLLVLPVGWARGLVQPASVASLSLLPAAGAQCVGLGQLPSTAEAVDSALARLWQAYRRLVGRQLQSSEAVHMLRLEQQLRWRFAPGCLESALLRQPWPLDSWLDALPQAPGRLASDLLELLTLLPCAEQAALGQTLGRQIRARLGDDDGEGVDRPAVLELLAALLGVERDGNPPLLAAVCELRSLGLEHAARLQDPALRGLALVPLLQGVPGASPLEIGRLVAAIDELALRSEAARDGGDQPSHRHLNGVLAMILQSASGQPPLLGSLLLALQPNSLKLLGSLPMPAVCLSLLQGLLLLDSAWVSGLEESRLLELVNLAERILPRIWWQRSLLLELLERLRDQTLELAWLWEHSVLLKGLERLYSRGNPPLPLADGQSEPWPEPHELDAPGLLRAQVLMLLRLFPDPHPHPQAGRLLRLAGSAGKPPLLRLLDGEDEEALLMAATAGLTSRTTMLVRLSAERCGVAELLPPLLPAGPLVEAFGHILEHWRGHFGARAGSALAPLAVVICTRAEQLELLRLALESLSLQVLWPQEVWLVDDGSPPGLAAELAGLVAACRRQQKLPLRLLRRCRQEGAWRCRDLALQFTAAEAMVLHEADALSHPLRLARQWRQLKRGSGAVRSRHLRLDPATAAPQPDGEGGLFFGEAITTVMVKRSTTWEQGWIRGEDSRGGSTLLSQPLCLMPARQALESALDRAPL